MRSSNHVLAIATIAALGLLLSFARPAEAVPVSLPGDNAAVSCGPNIHLDKSDFTGGDNSSYSVGCDLEVQVSKFKLFAGVDTVDGVALQDVEYRVGTVFPLGTRTRLTVSGEGHSGYDRNDGFSVDSSFIVRTRVGVVF